MLGGWIRAAKQNLPDQNQILTRNYHREHTNVAIAIVTIPIVDIERIVGIDPTNVGNVGANLLLKISRQPFLTGDSLMVSPEFYLHFEPVNRPVQRQKEIFRSVQ